MTKQLPDESIRVIEEACTANGVSLIDYTIRGHEHRMILDLYIDSVSGVTLDQCSFVSRVLNEASATDKFLGNVYSLEVSSPGVDRPLKFNWQYTKHIGRLLSVSTTGGVLHRGRMTHVDEVTLCLLVASGKEKLPVTLPFAEIAEAKVEIEMSR